MKAVFQSPTDRNAQFPSPARRRFSSHDCLKKAPPYVPEEAEAPVVCGPTDLMTLYNRRLMQGVTWWERLAGWEECRKFLRYESKLARRTDVSVFCSRVDLESVKAQAPEVKCEIVPNAVYCEKHFFKKKNEEEPGTVVFTGTFEYRPNRHIAKSFGEKIFPLVQREVPGVKFLAVRNGASYALRGYWIRPGVAAMDFVPDLRAYLAKAAVAVAPLTVGSGVSNKLVEGFVVRTPVVATPLACGDLPVKSGEHLLTARNAGELAEHVVKLLGNPDLRRQMAVRARRFVEEQYDLESASRKVKMVMEGLVERAVGGSKQASAVA